MSERMYKGYLPGQHVISAYGAGGFRFADMSHRGSLLVMPSGIHAIDAVQIGDVTLAMLAPLLDLPKGLVSFLLIGTGAKLEPIGVDLRRGLVEQGITLEAMATGHAIATYNIMMEEQRPVAAVLLASA